VGVGRGLGGREKHISRTPPDSRGSMHPPLRMLRVGDGPFGFAQGRSAPSLQRKLRIDEWILRG
jgi:hypothetical protein